MAELEIERRITKARDNIKELEDKIEEKLEKVDFDESKLGSGVKGHITKWNKKIKEYEAQISKDEEIVKSLRTKLESTSSSSGGGTSTSNTSSLNKELKNMKNDFDGQSMFRPPMDVSLFVRNMQMLHNTHCKHNTSLEADFITACEAKIDTTYRIALQEHVSTNGRFLTWAAMKKYLVSTHRSATTLFKNWQR